MKAELERIYSENRQGLYTLALSITRQPEQAEDAVHDALLRLCKTESKPSGDPVAYVFAAVRNAAVDQIRKRARAIDSGVSVFADPTIDTDTWPDQAAATSERDALLRRAVDDLPDDQREAIVLKLFAGLTFDQIARSRNEPLSTVSSRYRRALERLKKSIETFV